MSMISPAILWVSTITIYSCLARIIPHWEIWYKAIMRVSGACLTLMFVVMSLNEGNLEWGRQTEPAKGWAIDLFLSYPIITVFVSVNMVATSITDGLLLIVNHAHLLIYMFTTEGPLRRRTIDDVICTCVIYAIIAGYEIFLWYPIIQQWSQDHCFLDGFIDLTTNLGIYASGMGAIIYILVVVRIYKIWLSCHRVIATCGVVISIVAFYNAAVGLALYAIGTEVATYYYS